MGVYNKTLRWLEPYGGWDYNSCDTGLCNRILHWEVAYEISKKNNFDYKIILEKLHWPELDLIWLPFTAYEANYEHFNGIRFDRDYQKLHFISVFDTEKDEVRKASPISELQIKKMFRKDNFNLIKDNHWYSNFGYSELLWLYQYEVEDRPLSHIKLRHNFIEDFLRRNTYDVVGIHLRRNEGVKYKEEDLIGMTEELVEKYKKNHIDSHSSNRNLNYVSDEKYFTIMDEMLKENKHQKFYISTDLPLEFVKNFKDKYEDLILTREDFHYIIRDYLVNSNIRVIDIEKNNTLDNIIDLFALSFCKFLIRADNSTWSEFAQHYRNQPTFSVKDDLNQIMNKYINPNWGQPVENHFMNDEHQQNKLQKTATK